jgi:hypothetical protein
MWRRKIPLDTQPTPHERGYEIRIPVRGYDVRVTRALVVYDEVRVTLKPSVFRSARGRRA